MAEKQTPDYRAYAHDVTILLFQNSETAAIIIGVPNQSYGSWTLLM